MDTSRMKAVVAAMVLPAYLVVWTTGTACDDPESGYLIFYLQACFHQPPIDSRASGDALEIVGFDGDIFFHAAPAEPIAKNEKRRVLSTVFGVPTSFPEANLTVSGMFFPTALRDSADRARRPRKLIVEFAHLDSEGRKVDKAVFKSKIKGDQIRESTRLYPRMDLEVGDKLDLLVRPKGNALSFDEDFQLFFTMALDSGSFAALARSVRAGAPLPGTFRAGPRLAAAKAQEIFTSTFGIDTSVPRSALMLSGNITWATAPADADRVRPTSVKVTLTHLDELGRKLKRYSIIAGISDSTIVQVAKILPALPVKVGQALQLSIQPKGGSFDVNDVIRPVVTWGDLGRSRELTAPGLRRRRSNTMVPTSSTSTTT